ncbi:MAG: CZB domain-containing protein [Gammaproteobacteria bacterium]|jgi:hypothetical protein|nr:CZB domain-containing protein [Gammaproteobacteria bacterium]MBT4810330.1 CZB domain-containing protein [Thiotrichales bacterium]MBT3472343.1 CZB domain-containing protein [Gammaproteobacteria bacterium]MBT3966910.1 CZB domain-containing protein [Gammaproteobacteria bacterium]MBT4081944.1 CZB domain-containing protein [Gammaproteobacteria bacterium]
MISDLGYMRLVHLSWELQLEELLDTHHASHLEVDTHEECPLGVWLYREGLAEFGNVLEVQKLERDHKLFHQSVRRVIRSHKHGRKSEASDAMAEVKHLSREIIYMLTVVEFKLLRKKSNQYAIRHPLRALSQFFRRR